MITHFFCMISFFEQNLPLVWFLQKKTNCCKRFLLLFDFCTKKKLLIMCVHWTFQGKQINLSLLVFFSGDLWVKVRKIVLSKKKACEQFLFLANFLRNFCVNSMYVFLVLVYLQLSSLTLKRCGYLMINFSTFFLEIINIFKLFLFSLMFFFSSNYNYF